ncbi:MAG TPA: hypothetical protein VIK55_19320 [Paludibacter sp.]
MKTKNIIYLVVVLLFACSTTKKTTETKLKATDTSKTDVSKETVKNTTATTADNTKLNDTKSVDRTVDLLNKQVGEITGSLKTYDTTKPVDSITGRPPLASELIFTNRTSTDNAVKQTEKTTTTTAIVKDIKAAVKEGLNIKVDSVAETKALLAQEALTTKIRTTNNWWWIVMLVVAGAGVGYFFIRKIPFVVIWIKIKGLFGIK